MQTPLADHAGQSYWVAPAKLDMRQMLLSPGTTSLTPLLANYQFFTPALPFIYGRFETTILLDFLQNFGRDVTFWWQRFKQPLFRGLQTPDGDPGWNHGLWAVEKAVWPALEGHLRAAVATDTANKHLYRYGAQDLVICDPLPNFLAIRTATLPIVALGVRSDCYTVLFKQVQPWALPEVVFCPPDPDCMLYRRAIFIDEDPEQMDNLKGKT